MMQKRRIAWIEASRFAMGWKDQNIYKGVLFPRAGPRMAGLLGRLGHEVEVISGELSEISPFEIARNFDVACLSMLSNTTPHSLILGKQLTNYGMKHVVGGGYQFSHNAVTSETLAPTDEALDFIPYVVRGEGYQSLPALLEAWEGKRALTSVGGLSYWSGNEKIHNFVPPLMSKDEINHLPLPLWEKVRDHRKMRVLSVHGMQGCPRNCSWCAVWTRDGRRNRNTDAALVVDEMEKGLSLGHFHHVFMSADNFTVIERWAREVCEEIIRRGIRIGWTCQAEVRSALNRDLIALMARAGCERWCIGLESTSPEALKNSNKSQNLLDTSQAIRNLQNAGIKIHGMFIVGLPGDNKETLDATLRWAKRMNLDSVQFLCLSDLPGSKDYENLRLWEKAFQPFKGTYKVLNWLFVNGHYARLGNEALTLADVQQACISLMKRFYSASSLAQSLFLPRWTDFRHSLDSGFGLMRSAAMAFKQSWLTAYLRFQGFVLTRQWDKMPLNQMYRKLLTYPHLAERIAQDLLSHIPKEWLAVLDQVETERRSREKEALVACQ
ncbi:MAG: B12-binding domain-containing radical SAM protein [Armatimonadetes bacterium]|nr:B12-binding domain-containing radical SAM protein [Armatimonadota bacterium]